MAGCIYNSCFGAQEGDSSIMSKVSRRKSVGVDGAGPMAVATPRENQKAATGKASPFATYGITTLLSAFLLFQVQLLMGKFILPRFGGGPSVWSTSLLVFQVLLLLGYGYAAFLSAKFDARTQGKIHLLLLAGSSVLISIVTVLGHSPILPSNSWKPYSSGSPVAQITLLLTASVGFYCVLLSATSPLLQKWFSSRNSGAAPYRLYALSNLGSVLGLLSYPFLMERILTLSNQAWMWAAGYALFLATAGGCAFLQMQHIDAPVRALKQRPRNAGPPSPRPRFLWLALAACASTMLLATTNLICQEVAAIPLLWVLPLSLYLLSFVVCFDHPRWYRREIFNPLYLILALLSLKILPNYSYLTIPPLLLIFCAALLAVCMVCHGELARLKPEPQHLTTFYLMVSFGGALGSAFVVLLAPRIFDRFWEFQIALLGCGLLLVTALVRDRASWLYGARYAWVGLFAGVLVLMAGAYKYTGQLREFEGEGKLVVWRTRNFFGVKTVLQMPEGKFLVHGHTLHGSQNANAAIKNEPTTYYVRSSGVGLLLDNYPRSTSHPGLRVGAIGMGAGTLAAYARPGDYYRFYEIDPAIADLSLGTQPTFTFLQSGAGTGDIVLGDARITMQEEVSSGETQKFDILVVDAFSGDAIPVHLLTREAMGVYLRQLRGPNSVVAFHVSNVSIDLRPVVDSLCRAYHLASVEVHSTTGDAPDWVLLSQDPAILQLPALAKAGRHVEVRHAIKPWTDDYSSLYDLMAGG
jgi:hypothetical protein